MYPASVLRISAFYLVILVMDIFSLVVFVPPIVIIICTYDGFVSMYLFL